MTDDQRKQTDRDNLADLIHEAVNAGGDDLSFDLAYSIAGCFVGSEWLKEHVAAARREALLEAANDMETAEFEDMRHVGCSPEAWKGWSDGSLASLMEGPMLWAPWLRDRAAALAEPERDEEGGR